MRRTVLATSVALLLMFAPASAALAVDLPSSRHPVGSAPGDQAPVKGSTARAHFVPLGVKLTGNATVNGHVYDFSGNAMSGAYVSWEAPYGGTWEWGETLTDTSGAYSFSRLPAASDNGSIYVDSMATPWWSAWRDYASWADPGTTTFDWRPGVVSTFVTRGGGVWEHWNAAFTYLYGYDALSNVTGASAVQGSGDVVSGSTYTPAGTYVFGATYFWMDQGLEYPFTGTVTAGSPSQSSVNADQADAQRILVTKPYWASGKPGTVATVGNWQFPAGWVIDYYGYADSPSGKPYKEYSDVTTTGVARFNKTATIPSTAPAGYSYVVAAYNTNGVLLLETPFQVCTLKSTKTSVRKGGAIKLSGVIPTQGHWGSQAGKSKYVTIYRRTKSVSAAPTAWDATTKGWTRVAKVKANGLGKYTSAYLRPSRTTWYVVRYPGDDWYWGAYTSVLKVRVY